MKKTAIRISLLVVLILLGIFLYTMGKEHKIYIDNKDFIVGGATYTANSVYRVWVDGKEIGEVRNGKKKVALVAGPSHEIIVQEIVDGTISGDKIMKKFKTATKEIDITINLPALVNDDVRWLKK